MSRNFLLGVFATVIALGTFCGVVNSVELTNIPTGLILGICGAFALNTFLKPGRRKIETVFALFTVIFVVAGLSVFIGFEIRHFQDLNLYINW